ncbi:MAG: membrane protein insertase YidC, partial [Bacteroidetes bacterium]
MQRQTWIGLFLLTLLMFLWTFWMARTSVPSGVGADTLATPAQPKQAAPLSTTPALPDRSADSSARAARYGAYAPFTEGKDSLFVVQTPYARWVFGTRGARVVEYTLSHFRTAEGQPVVLWDSTQVQRFLFAEGRTILASDELYFTLLHAPKGPVQQSDSVVFRLAFSPDTFIQVVYRLSGLDYRVGWEVRFVGLAGRLRNPYLLHSVQYTTPRTEASVELMRPHCAFYYRQGEEVASLTPEEDEPIQQALQGRIRWVSAKGQFFCALFQGEEAFSDVVLRALPYGDGLPAYQAELQLPLVDGKAQETWYFGPTRYALLRRYGEGYEKQLNLGWSFIRYINTAFIIPVFGFLEKFIPSYGVIITILALLVKIILSPLTWRSYLVGVRMQVIQELPEVKALEEKYKDQPDKLMIERSLLFQQLGVNPLSGCVPLLLQIPIFFAMTSFFPNAFELRQQGFLWASDLSSYDAVLKWGFRIPVLGDHLSLFALLTALSTLAYTYFTQRSQP